MMDRQQNPAVLSTSKKWNAAAGLILFSVTILLYASTLGHGFIYSWDDYDYVVNNRAIQGISLEHVRTVFTNFYVGNYAPLHLISYMLDFQIWGLDPAGYHLGNILLHAVNGLLICRLFIKLELPTLPALFGAALFVLHPVQVESVAWVAERKNVLSALFFLLALLSYIDYRQAVAGRVRNYILSLTFLACALLTKSAAVIFPVVIVCYDYCYCSESRRLKLVDNIPFLLFTLAACILTIKSQDTSVGGGMRDYPGGTPLNTLWTMIPVFLSYLKDLVYPLDLSPYYIVPIRTSADGTVFSSAAVLLGLAGLGIMSVRHCPRLLFFVCVYFIALLPVLQIVPILTLKNDRYLYFPMIGAAGAAAMMISTLMRRSARVRTATVAIAVAICTLFGGATYFQSRIWKDTTSLWKFALRKNPDNMLAWLMLAKEYTRLGNARDAITAITNYNTLKSKYGPLRGWEGA